jgi:hypothetical protein
MNFLMMRDSVLDKLCPKMIVRAAASKDDRFSPNIIELLPTENIANLEKIECNVLEPVLLRLLVCKDEKSVEFSDICPYPKHKNQDAVKLVCDNSGLRLAQIYIRLEREKSKSRSCLILFVEGQYLAKTDELIERMKNSVSWLDIEDEKPYFYIFHYGQPVFNITASNSCRRINARIKELFTGYSQDEDICIAESVRRGSKSLIVNHTKLFSLKAS